MPRCRLSTFGITLVPGDYNHDGVVNAADYVFSHENDGTLAGYNTGATNFGQTAGSSSSFGAAAITVVPEPATIVMPMFAAAGLSLSPGCSETTINSLRRR